MAIPIDKEMRDRAKKDNKVLIQVCIDARHLPEHRRAELRKKLFGGKFSVSGPLSDRTARELWLWYLRALKRGEL